MFLLLLYKNREFICWSALCYTDSDEEAALLKRRQLCRK
jgi:hypothetical protein